MRRFRPSASKPPRRAFTLLEVLLVIGIISLLAAFVVPQFHHTQLATEIDVARLMVDDGGSLATQIDLFRMNVGRYPRELKELYFKPEEEPAASRWRGPYIKGLGKLKDPWGNELQYQYPGEVKEDSYDLYSLGPDGEDGTDDDLANYTVGETVRSP